MKYTVEELVPTKQYANIKFIVSADTPQEIVASMKEVMEEYRKFYSERIKEKEVPKPTF